MAAISLVFASVVFWIVFKVLRMGHRDSSLPPGPPTRPIVGNAHIFPSHDVQFQFTEWARKYGDIFSVMIGSTPIIVLTSFKAVKEVMDHQSSVTSDRPANFMVDIVTEGIHLALARYSDLWRTLRKAAHAVLTPNAVIGHQPIQAAEGIQLMYDILKKPDALYAHIGRYSASVITSVVFGKRYPSHQSPELILAFNLQPLLERAFQPGAHPPVDALPFLHYVPERWAPWKGLAKEARERQRELYLGLFAQCEERVGGKGEKGGNGCYLEEVVRRRGEYGLTREMVAYLGGVFLEGGAFTTTSFLYSFILLMTAYPEVQRKAQAEIDLYIGDGRTPLIEDIDGLPYCRAVIKEVHRFRPVAPLGIPHGATGQGEYRGYTIPKGSTIFMNVWGIYHDPDIYADPDTFNPDRFMINEQGTIPGVEVKDFKDTLMFGAGRRMCPGRHIAANHQALNVMNILWAFDMTPSLDPETLKPKVVDVSPAAYEEHTFSQPRPYKCTIKPRTPTKASLIESEFIAAGEAFEKYEYELCEVDREVVERERGRGRKV